MELNGQPVVISPRELTDDKRFNTYRTVRGRQPGIAYLLLERSTLDQLDRRSTRHTLRLSYSQSKTVLIRNLTFIRATQLIGINVSDPDSVYAVEFADIRWWGRYFPINSVYNIRAFDTNIGKYDLTKVYYKYSTNNETAWTYKTMLEDIWKKLPTDMFGPAPTLPLINNQPVLPDDRKPENYSFLQTTAWDAYNQVLEDNGLTIVPDHDPDNFTPKFRIISLDNQYPGEQALIELTNQNAIRNSVTLDGAYLPEKIRVYFPARHADFQKDPDVLLVTPQDKFRIDSNYTIDKNITDLVQDIPLNPLPKTVLTVCHPTPARYTDAGTIENQSDLNTLATNLAKRTAFQLIQADKDIILEGIHDLGKLLPNVPGSCGLAEGIKGICYGDYGEGLFTEYSLGFRRASTTESNIPGLFFGGILPQENTAPPDIIRNQNYPTRIAVVELYETLSANGRAQAKVLYGVIPNPNGTITWNPNGDNRITVHDISGSGGSTGQRCVVWFNDQVGRWVILFGGSGVTAYLGKSNAAIAKLSTGQFTVYDPVTRGATTQILVGWNMFANIKANVWVIAIVLGGLPYFIAAEC